MPRAGIEHPTGGAPRIAVPTPRSARGIWGGRRM